MGPHLCCRKLSATQDFAVAAGCHTAVSIFIAISKPALFRLINSRNREGRIPQFMTSVLQGEVVFHLLSVKKTGGKQTNKQKIRKDAMHLETPGAGGNVFAPGALQLLLDCKFFYHFS